jgi:antitoxin component YwqK of YwqJK toxin-antitoxin module
MIAGGKSQNALTNLAEAAPAIRNYANERRALRGEERSIRDAEFKIKAADASARQGQADKAIAMMMDNRKLNAQLDISKLDRESREKVAELNRQTNLKIQELTNLKPTEFDKKLREAKASGQYKQPNGEFDMKAFLEDLRFSGSGSASLQKAIMEQYELSDEKANGMSFEDYFRQRMAAFGQGQGGLNTNLFPGFSATLDK